jgi:glycosyltransferase involved in cell wall biosynthesis
VVLVKYRFHLLGLPHVWTGPEHSHCAYTSKIWKALKMFGQRGHEVISYGNEGSVNPYGEQVQILTEAERASWFGPFDKQKLYHLLWDPAQPYWQLFNTRCVAELLKRVRKGDFILTLAGNCQVGPIGDHFPGSYYGIQQTIALVEFGIGYYGTQSRYRVYESHGHREWCAGAQGLKVGENDTAVVPNYFDLDEFDLSKQPPADERLQSYIDKPCYLFIGRIVPDKGWDIALEVTRDIGARLVIAGQGDIGELPPMSQHVLHFGPANIAERAHLMHKAIATFAPTTFREPFGGVAVESQLCSTPAITTDYGAFMETVDRRWRCASHREFCEAAQSAAKLISQERQEIRKRAEYRYSLDAVAPLYERYFDRLYSRWWGGYYEMRDLDTLELP